jgi:hypothetical protein
MIISRPVLLKVRNIPDNFVQKIKTHVLFSVMYFFLCEKNVEKFCSDGQATGDNMAHAHSILVT